MSGNLRHVCEYGLDQVSTDSAFEDIVAQYGTHELCQQPTRAGSKCTRTARWLFESHCCDAYVMCGQHVKMWTRIVEKIIATYGYVSCQYCKCRLSTVDDLFTARSL